MGLSGNIEDLAEKIQMLSPEQILEVEISSTFFAPGCRIALSTVQARKSAIQLLQRSAVTQTTASTMPYEFGDVILVPFPFTNQIASTHRPAVVVSSRAYNTVKSDIVVMVITSQVHSVASIGEVWVADWRAANLLKPSAIKPVFATSEQALAIRNLGVLTLGDQSSVRAAITAVLG